MAESFSTRLARAIADPWVLLTSALGGGMGWAVSGGSIDVGAAIGFGMLGVAGLTAALTRSGTHDELTAPKEPELRRSTPQYRLVDALTGYLADLKELRESTLPDSVTDSAIEALVATDGSRAQALRVAEAIDKLDDALQRSSQLASGPGSTGVQAAIDRMQSRRQALLGKLESAVGEVAEVYTKLLELSATVDTLDVGSGKSEVEQVNASLDSLRMAFAELEQDAQGPS